MIHTANIANLTHIRLGHTFRGKVKAVAGGEIAVLQPRNVQNGKLIEEPVVVSSNQIPNLDKHRLNPGDLLLSNKGTKFASFVYEGNPGKAVASSSFFVLVPQTDKIDPHYLHWYMSQEPALKDLAMLGSKTTIATLSKKGLERLNVRIPDLVAQQQIKEVVKQVEEEQDLLEQLIRTRQEYRDAYCWELMNNDHS